jgi:hypothetical protein
MEGLMQPDSLRTRILLWTEDEIRLDRLPSKSGAIIEAVLYRDELPRAAAAGVSGCAGIAVDAGLVSGPICVRVMVQSKGKMPS